MLKSTLKSYDTYDFRSGEQAHLCYLHRLYYCYLQSTYGLAPFRVKNEFVIGKSCISRRFGAFTKDKATCEKYSKRSGAKIIMMYIPATAVDPSGL